MNDGTITGGAYNFKGPIFRQRGTLIGTSLSVSGPSEFENLGDIDIMGLVSLDVLRFINSDSLKAGSVIGSKLLSHLENARGASIILYDGGTFKTANTTMVMNDGSITGGSYEFGGPSLVQQGILKGKSLKVRNGSEIITSDNQEMEIVDAIETCFAGPWALRGKTKTTRFSHLGSLDLFGILEVVGEFEGSGTIRSTGQLIGRAIDFLDDMTVLGEVEAERLTAIKKLVVNGKVKVKRAISTKGGLKVGDRGVFQGASLSVSGTPEFENLGDIDIADSVSLNVSRFINSNSLKAKSITGSILLTYLENARDASIVLRGGVFKTLSRTMVVNDGSIVGGSYEFAGPSLVQQGILKGKALRIRNGSTFITSKTQEMEIIDAIETCSADPYVLRGKIETARFSHLGNMAKLKLQNTLL